MHKLQELNLGIIRQKILERIMGRFWSIIDLSLHIDGKENKLCVIDNIDIS